MTAPWNTLATFAMLVGSDAKPVNLKQFPKLRYTRVFAPLGGGMPSIASIPAQVLPHCSFKDKPTPALVNPWLQALNRSACLTYNHEPEGDISPADYKAGWEALASLVNASPNGHFVTLVEIYTRYAQVHGKQTPWGPATWQNMWTGQAAMMAWDCYLEANATSFPTPATFFSGLIESASICGVPYMVPEFASLPMPFDPTGAKLAAWMTACANYLRAQGCLAVAAWDNPAGGNYVLTGLPLAAWQAVVASQPG